LWVKHCQIAAKKNPKKESNFQGKLQREDLRYQMIIPRRFLASVELA
jgi:hypothetical protein